MNKIAAFAFALLAACGGATTSTPATPTPPTPTGPRMIHKGEQLDAVLRLGEKHIYTIELTGGEQVHWTVEGDSGPNGEGRGCGNWGYAWIAPGGAWVTGNPLGLAPNEDGSGLRSAALDLTAAVAGGGEMVPTAGLWELQIEADGTNCARIDYRVRAE